MTNRSETFGRLLKAGISSIVNCEGKKAAIVEDELGQLIGISGDSIQRYKSGHLPPEERTIAILAEAAIRRGYLGREWLQRFLHAARYPFADTLLDQLCPIGPMRPRLPRVYHNLPAPTYSQFVMRAQAFAEVINGLQQRSAVVLIVGLGGNGKTSLAREVAARCLQDNDTSHFDAVVWVSDKDHPGTTNLSVVLDEIARTLDYPGFAQFAHDEKLYEVGQLLKRQRVLLVVDNFETISDGALLSWLLRLPEPSKALITSREYSRVFRSNTSVLDLRGMLDIEAQEFVDQRLHFLKIERLVSDQAQLEPLLVATGGNPKAIEIALGLIKHERRPLQQVVDDLYAARGGLFDNLFTHAWALLDEAARRVLLVMTFFPASASSEALSATADVQGFAFDRAVERLTDLALLDTQQEDLNSAPRYALHALVRAFGGARIKEQPEFEQSARERWIEWYVQLASKVRYCWNDLGKLDILDQEQAAILVVAKWTFQQKRYSSAISITSDTSYYYYVRSLFEEALSINLICAESAKALNDPIREIEARIYYAHILVRQGNIEEAAKELGKIARREYFANISTDTYADFQHALGLCYLSRGDVVNAEDAWQKIVLLGDRVSKHRSSISRAWIAFCMCQYGNIGDAQNLMYEVLEEFKDLGHDRGVAYILMRLADIALQAEDHELAEQMLLESRVKASEYQDRVHIADLQRLYARLYTLRGDLPAARVALAAAIDLFERLGLRRELAAARAAQAQLGESTTTTM